MTPAFGLVIEEQPCDPGVGLATGPWMLVAPTVRDNGTPLVTSDRHPVWEAVCMAPVRMDFRHARLLLRPGCWREVG